MNKYYNACYRCSNQKSRLYKNYGAKGIKVSVGKREFLEWYATAYGEFIKVYGPSVSASLGRIDHSKDYSLGNMEIVTVAQNTSEMYFRVGNPSPHGTKLDDEKCLAIYTMPNNKIPELAYAYGVHETTIRNVRRGTVRKDLYAKVQLEKRGKSGN